MESRMDKMINTKHFPTEWLHRFNETELERLAIMTVDFCLSDAEAIEILENSGLWGD